MIERINQHTSRDQRRGHEFRYQLAAGLLIPDDVVLDAACGSGYGSAFLKTRGSIFYYGVDRDLSELEVEPTRMTCFIEADLCTWQPSFGFDVFVGFETVEHLVDYRHYLTLARTASRVIVLSVPVIPTVGTNPWHVHDFQPGDLPALMEHGSDWRCTQSIEQPSEFSEIYVFERRP